MFALVMTLPLDLEERPERVGALVGMMLGLGYTIGGDLAVRARRRPRRDRLVRRRALGLRRVPRAARVLVRLCRGARQYACRPSGDGACALDATRGRVSPRGAR